MTVGFRSLLSLIHYDKTDVSPVPFTRENTESRTMSNLGTSLSRAIRVVLIGAVAVLICTPVCGQGPVSIEPISKAWQARQDRVTSGRFAWVERKTIVAGYYSTFLAQLPSHPDGTGVSPGEVVPPQDLTFDVSALLVFDGEKTRFSNDDREWSPKEHAYVPTPNTMAFNGKKGTWLHTVGSPLTPWPQASIKPNNWNKVDNVLPLMMAFRPFVATLRFFDLETFVSTGQTALVGGSTCPELRFQKGDFIRRIWVDPSREYLIVRVLDTVMEQIVKKIDIHYRNDRTYGWVPETWENVTLEPAGKLAITIRASVNKCEMNVPFSAKEFEIEFPLGTRVVDMTDPTAEVNYIVKEGDRKRIILPEDIGATYEQMLNSRPGEALGKPVKWGFSWLVVGLVVSAAVAGSLLLWRRWRGLNPSK
jgi:hypothetical protein